MKVRKRTLLLIAGLVWGCAGFNILRIGIAAYSAYWNIWNVLISLAVYLAFQLFIFSRMVKKHTVRIVGYEEEKQFFLKFFDVKAFCIMGFMIALGVGLRISGICPDIFIAVFYTGLGASLLTAGVLFLVNFVRNQPSPLPEADRTELCEIVDKTESSEEIGPSVEKESELSPLS